MHVDSFRKLRVTLLTSDARCKRLGEHLAALGATVVRASGAEDAALAPSGDGTLLVIDQASFVAVKPSLGQSLAEARRAGTLRIVVLIADMGSAANRGLAAAAVDEVISPHASSNDLAMAVSRAALPLVRAARRGTPGGVLRTRVLLADDSELLRHMTSAILARAGYQVTCAGDPFATYSLLRSEAPDIALIDYHMPGLRGDMVIEMMKRDGLCTPMLLYSSAPEHVLRAAAARSGAVGYILKGSGPEVIVGRIEQALRERAEPRAAGR